MIHENQKIQVEISIMPCKAVLADVVLDAAAVLQVPLEKGYSQVDWLKLSRANPNLNGLHGKALRRDITMEEVKRHKTPEDAWMVFKNRVSGVYGRVVNEVCNGKLNGVVAYQ